MHNTIHTYLTRVDIDLFEAAQGVNMEAVAPRGALHEVTVVCSDVMVWCPKAQQKTSILRQAEAARGVNMEAIAPRGALHEVTVVCSDVMVWCRKARRKTSMLRRARWIF